LPDVEHRTRDRPAVDVQHVPVQDEPGPLGRVGHEDRLFGRPSLVKGPLDVVLGQVADGRTVRVVPAAVDVLPAAPPDVSARPRRPAPPPRRGPRARRGGPPSPRARGWPPPGRGRPLPGAGGGPRRRRPTATASPWTPWRRASAVARPPVPLPPAVPHGDNHA